MHFFPDAVFPLINHQEGHLCGSALHSTVIVQEKGLHAQVLLQYLYVCNNQIYYCRVKALLVDCCCELAII